MKYLWTSMLASVMLFVTGCGDLAQPDNPQVTGGEVVVSATAKQIRDGLIKKKVPGITEDTEMYGYRAYSIPYTTTDEEGKTVQVSGLMVVPQDIPESKAALIENVGFSVVSDDHGTIFSNREAPTVSNEMAGTPQGAAVILTALHGFVTLQPDYIGFGDSSDHYHPYVLKDSLANATIDFIRAARVFAEKNQIALNPLLFVTGYSEGGYAAMATMKKIESDPALMQEMGVTMAAPMAGPYALDYMAAGVLKSDTIGVPSFMADVAYAYAKRYSQSVEDVISAPYASKLENLLSGDYNRTEIDPQLTHKTKGEGGLFKMSFVADFFGPTQKGNPDNWFLQAVSQNSLYKWAPKTPMALVQCEGDSVIPYGLSTLAYQAMTAMGASNLQQVPVEKTLQAHAMGNGDPMDHGECGAPAYGVAAGIFEKIRKQYVGY